MENFIKQEKLVCVIIPVYNEELTSFEEKSFEKCLEVLKNHPITIITSDSLKLNNYTYDDNNIQIVRFAPHYFNGIEGYCKLMLSSDFYKQFTDYKYVLIYQLDCYVFNDDLEYWCNRGYDYIGAPWIEDDTKCLYEEVQDMLPRWATNHFIRRLLLRNKCAVGNGGFSLRKVESHNRAIEKHQGTIKNWWPHLEDVFWSIYLPLFDANFKIPKSGEASHFSLEANPDYFFNKNGREIPFGCHAWYKDSGKYYDRKFWKQYIVD